MAFIAVYITTATKDEAQRIGDELIQQKLIACANVFPIASSYFWQDAVVNEDEWVALVKTIPEKWDELVLAIEKIHPYETPCIMKFHVEANPAYEQWISACVRATE